MGLKTMAGRWISRCVMTCGVQGLSRPPQSSRHRSAYPAFSITTVIGRQAVRLTVGNDLDLV